VEAVADKGYHGSATLTSPAGANVRTYILEPDRGQRKWKRQPLCRYNLTLILSMFPGLRREYP
jgi:hypothetical protein